ncbi:hypothetical protein FACS189476_09980 [Spirochaetia bacterium]|nr:hypothetical protein FACS189476_09980 [Spirochaetia bacterium]
MSGFIEQKILSAVESLLTGRVNELLEESEYQIPLIEFGCGNAPAIRLTTAERSEKDRIIRADAYTLALVFSVSETPNGELDCYAYAAAMEQAIGEDPTLGGVVDRAMLTGKKYTPPRVVHCGEHWELAITLRITIEGMSL